MIKRNVVVMLSSINLLQKCTIPVWLPRYLQSKDFIQLFIRVLVYSFNRTTSIFTVCIYLPPCSLICLFAYLLFVFVYLCLLACLFSCFFISSFISFFTRLFTCFFTCYSLRLLVHLFTCKLVYLVLTCFYLAYLFFTCLCIYFIIYLFIYLTLYPELPVIFRILLKE